MDVENETSCVAPNCDDYSTTVVAGDPKLKKTCAESLQFPDSGSTPETFQDEIRTAESDPKEISEESCPQEVCRLCMSSDVKTSIYDKFDEDVTIAVAITLCIPLLKITKTDQFSKFICESCHDKIKGYYDFRSQCLQVHATQRNAAFKRKSTPPPPSKKSKTDEKFDRVEAELMRVIEGELPEDIKHEENIIIEVQSDAEEEIVNFDDKSNVLKTTTGAVILPKDIQVKVNRSKVGLMESQPVEGFYNCDFCLVNSYLFEFGLTKGDFRFIKCIVGKCKSSGYQSLEEGFDDKVFVKTPHNHAPPNKADVKKLIVLNVMCKRLQNDKSLNFRNVYEEFCEKDPEIRELIPLKTVIKQICSQQSIVNNLIIGSFDSFYNLVEDETMKRLHFTLTNRQFYQEKFRGEDGSMAVIFANQDTINQFSDSDLMYVDSSFKIETKEEFKYHLVTILVWVSDSYYPIVFALISERSQDIYRTIFTHLHDTLAPSLRPKEIVTDYESAIYYSLGEIYLDSHIGGSVFYYTQNLYKKICSLNLARDLETNSCFRNIYYMILMLPLLPVNTISDGLNNIILQANEMHLTELAEPIFEHVRTQWMSKVTPDLFCVHRLENRINENVVAPFKRLRDYLMLSKGKMLKQPLTIVSVVERLIELEHFLHVTYSAPSKRSFARDLSSSQKKNVIKAWHYIESHPKININNFFNKVLGYIKCMENQLWIWGFYRYAGGSDDELIDAANFSIVSTGEEAEGENAEQVEGDVVMDVVIIDENDGFLVKNAEEAAQGENATYVNCYYK